MEFDYARASALLDIVQKVANVAPGFTAISSEAMSELREMNEHLRKSQSNKVNPNVMPGMPVSDPIPSKPLAGPDGVRAENQKKSSKPDLTIPATAPTAPSNFDASPQSQLPLRAPIDPTPGSPAYTLNNDGSREPIPEIERRV